MPTRAAGRVQRLAAHLEPRRASSPPATAPQVAGECARHPIVFWHYPKTGGTSLRKLLKQWAEHTDTPLWKKEGCHPPPCAGYLEGFAEHWGETKGQYRERELFRERGLLISHMRGWGVHELMPHPSAVRYITLLREPVARTVSGLNYNRGVKFNKGVTGGSVRLTKPP